MRVVYDKYGNKKPSNIGPEKFIDLLNKKPSHQNRRRPFVFLKCCHFNPFYLMSSLSPEDITEYI